MRIKIHSEQLLWSPLSESHGPRQFGYAAGCAAVAVPGGERTFRFLGYALGAAFGPTNPKGQARTRA
jgi:hypothetical protein